MRPIVSPRRARVLRFALPLAALALLAPAARPDARPHAGRRGGLRGAAAGGGARPGLYEPWMYDVFAVATVTANVLLLVGVLITVIAVVLAAGALGAFVARERSV
ncbi:hypothetical protein ACFPM7_25965 [Actinokineospora guangxiensis]|uniref:Uncharacterized protein n=1 Tax=Actinokineospora guangxiensis TaxID=1490288 RepID=A0ABW0ETK0_9PSEU